MATVKTLKWTPLYSILRAQVWKSDTNERSFSEKYCFFISTFNYEKSKLRVG